MTEVNKPHWVNTKWREVCWSTEEENKHLDHWHPDLCNWVQCAEECARDYWQDEKIDVLELGLEEEEKTYFAYLASILSDEYMSEETTATARKFFTNLGVQW